jgi:hypothetical protein
MLSDRESADQYATQAITAVDAQMHDRLWIGDRLG